jgi:hypothetical protein
VRDPGEQPHCRVVDLVLVDEHLERAEPVAVRVLPARRVVRVRALPGRHVEHLVGRDVEELRRRVDEIPDQPGAGDPIGLGRSLVTHFAISASSSSRRSSEHLA